MRLRITIGALALCLGMAATACAQFRQDDPQGIRLGESRVQKWRAGVIVKAYGGPCRGIVGYIPIPVDWPEQEVKIVEEEVSTTARVTYQVVDDTVKMMVVRVGYLPAGEEAKAVVTLEVKRSTQLVPEDPDVYRLPDVKKLDRKLRVYLGTSPKIESRDAKIRKLAREITAEEEEAWAKVEEMFDWVRENVEYEKGRLKGAAATLSTRSGDREDLTSLFIALCRAADVPARTVWVKGHCYAEFYLLDAEGQGHWFPCQLIGTREFGGISDLRPVLQKGDNFRPPYNRRDRQRFLAEHLTATGTSRPSVKFVRELVAD